MSKKENEKVEMGLVTVDNPAAEPKETTTVSDVAVKTTSAITTRRGKTDAIVAAVRNVVSGLKEEFLAANSNLNLDFVYLSSWLKIDAKGNFMDSGTEEVFGDSLEVIIGEGEQRFTLWGSEGTSFEGQLMVAESTLIEAEEKFDELIEQYRTTGEQEFENTHQKDKISSRYLMQVLPVCKLQSEVPEVYLVDLAFTSKLTFGKFSAQVFKGVFSKIGIPAKTGMSAVVVNMRTEGKVNDAKQKFMAIEFDAVKMVDINELIKNETEEV